MINGIHVIRQDKPIENGDLLYEYIGYVPSAKIGLPPERVSHELPDCVAKQINTLRAKGEVDQAVVKTVYEIRTTVNGHLYDPWNTVTWGVDRRYAEHSGKTPNQFVKVNERCFQFYMRYLQTHNNANYLNADRELVSG